ncbi:MAG: tRNA modification GTPase [Phycisphaerales bacterium]
MPSGTTIAAISTAPGNAPRAMLRVSGPDTRAIALDLLALDLSQRGAVTARFPLTQAHSIPVIAMRFPAPGSYTGEDTLEILIPGGAHLTQRVLERVLADDRVQLAQPGEFSARAYLNGRLSLTEAEGIALRISAQRDGALRAADALLDGRYGEQCRAWVDDIAGMLALVEAGVDFSDQEDVVPIAPGVLHARLIDLIDDLQQQAGAAGGGKVTDDRPSVVLVGKPNAGKSALFNALLGRERAVVSERAGTTRDALRETLDLTRDAPGAGSVELVDLAGIDRDSIDELDAQAQQLARTTLSKADALLWCDPSGRFDQGGFAVPNGAQIVRVRTKSDLPGAAHHRAGVEVCAFDPSTLGVLRRAIADATSRSSGSGVGVFVPRHRRALRSAIDSLTTTREQVDAAAHAIENPEIVAFGLRGALDALGELVGEVSPDDVIGRVFATFCVGK